MKRLMLLWTTVCAGLSACATQPLPADLHYRLDAAAEIATLPTSPALLLESFDAFGLYAERPLIYRRADAQGAVEQYRHQFWIEPPALMLSDGLRRSLRNAFGDAKVHARNARERTAYVIKPRLRRLEQVIEPTGVRAEFAVDFLVTDAAHAPRFVLQFEESLRVDSDAPAAFAAAASELAAKANRRLVERLVQDFAG